MACVAGGLDGGAAAGAECVAGLHAGAAAGTICQQRFAQDEVEDDADAVGQKDGQQGPHHITHTAAPGIAIDIAHQQRVACRGQRHHDSEQESQPLRSLVRGAQENKAQRDEAHQEHDTGGNPATERDHSLVGNGRHTILLSRRRREASNRAEAAPNIEEIPTQDSHTRTAESPASMRNIWPVSRTKAQAKTAAAPAKIAPWRRSASAASSALMRRTRSAGGWGTGMAESPAGSAANP